MNSSQRSTAVTFLNGAPNPQGRTVETVVAASDAWLEAHHDWVQWAFPNRDPSAFNPGAPLWTLAEARTLSPRARTNLLRMFRRFEHFLERSQWWRAPSDHNHARITRVLHCLRDARLYDEARALYDFVTSEPEPGTRSRRFWRDALIDARVTLRAFTAHDIDACLAVLGSNVPCDATQPELAEFRSFLATIDRTNCRYVVGECDGDLVACGGLACNATTGVATCCWGLVASALHRRGVGTRLLLARLAWIVDDARFTRVELNTTQHTCAFFARFGFERLSGTNDGCAQGLHRHGMVLLLDEERRKALRTMLATWA
jgi:predicted GNAT family N-acyltransferase